MNNVDRILNFIDENENNTEAPQEQPQEQAQQEQTTATTQEQPQEQPQQEQTTTITTDEKQYKGIIRRINTNIKRSRYPCIIEIDNKNMLFNNEDELRTYYNNIKDEHRQRLKEEKQRKINNYINKNKDSLRKTNKKNYILNDDEIITSEDNEKKIYKKGPLKAIQTEDDFIEVPRTNKKDRKKIYETVKKDKEILKKLINSETNEDFDTNTAEALKNVVDVNNIYNIHHDNPFNNDQTWTRESFIKFMDEMINKEEELRQEARKNVKRDIAQKKAIQENSPYNSYIINQGINPDLMKRY